LATPGYVSPPLLVSVGVYSVASGPPERVPFTVVLGLEPTLAPDEAVARVYTATESVELGGGAVEQVFPGVYTARIWAGFDAVSRIARLSGFRCPYRVVEARGRARAQLIGGVGALRLSTLVPEGEAGGPVVGLAVVSGGFGGCGVWAPCYVGAFHMCLDFPVQRHDFETVYLPMYSDPGWAGELGYELVSGVPGAYPAVAGLAVLVFYDALGSRGLPRLTLSLELYRGGERVGCIEDRVYPIIVWWEVPRALGERLHGPSSAGFAPSSKALLP